MSPKILQLKWICPYKESQHVPVWSVIKSFFFHLFTPRNICCGYLLESPQLRDSNKYPQHKFLRGLNTVFLNISNYLPHLGLRNRSIQIVVLTNFVVISNVGIKRFDCTHNTRFWRNVESDLRISLIPPPYLVLRGKVDLSASWLSRRVSINQIMKNVGILWMSWSDFPADFIMLWLIFKVLVGVEFMKVICFTEEIGCKNDDICCHTFWLMAITTIIFTIIIWCIVIFRSSSFSCFSIYVIIIIIITITDLSNAIFHGSMNAIF